MAREEKSHRWATRPRHPVARLASTGRTATRGSSRRFGAGVVCITALLASAMGCGQGQTQQQSAQAQGFEPSQSITLVVPYEAGGGTDLVFRTIAEAINKNNIDSVRWVVENRSGGSGTNGMRYVQSQGDDPHVLLATTPGHVTVPQLQNLDVSISDLTPIANLLVDPQMLWTHKSSPYKSVQDVIQGIQQDPESVSIATGPVGQDDSLTTALLEQAAEARFNKVPQAGGGDVTTALLGQQVGVGWLNPAEAAGKTVKEGGQLRPLAVALEDRLDSYPDVPTFKEKGHDVVYDFFFRAAMAPPDVSKEVANHHVSVLREATKTDEWQSFIKETQVLGRFTGGQEFDQALSGWTDRINELLAEVESSG